MDCSTWFLVVFKPKMTYPLPLGFQHVKYCGECVAGSFCGVCCAVLLFCMLKVALECTCSLGDQEFKRTGSPARAKWFLKAKEEGEGNARVWSIRPVCGFLGGRHGG
jgi:hypothetical protein